MIFFRLKLSSNKITTLEFGAFNHLINIQKVFLLFDDDEDDDDDYGEDDDDDDDNDGSNNVFRWTCLTTLWSATVISLGSLITGINHCPHYEYLMFMLLVLIIILSFRIILLTRDVAGAKARCANPSPNKNLLVILINFEHVKNILWFR